MEGERARVAGNARGVWDRGRAEKCVRSRRVVAVVLGVGVTQCRERGEAGEQASDLVEADGERVAVRVVEGRLLGA